MFNSRFFSSRHGNPTAKPSKLKCRRAHLCFEQFEKRIVPAGIETDGVAWVKVLGDDPAPAPPPNPVLSFRELLQKELTWEFNFEGLRQYYGDEAVGLFLDFLHSSPPANGAAQPARQFFGEGSEIVEGIYGGIVDGFRTVDNTTSFNAELAELTKSRIAERLDGSLLRTKTQTIDLGALNQNGVDLPILDLLNADEVATLLREYETYVPAPELPIVYPDGDDIPGFIAGGNGSDSISPDWRKIAAYVHLAGTPRAGTGLIDVQMNLTIDWEVADSIDFAPGDVNGRGVGPLPGSLTDLQELEQHGWAYDTPFQANWTSEDEVRYIGAFRETQWSTLTLVNGSLDFTDQFPGGKDDLITVSRTFQGYVFQENSGKKLFANTIPGAIGSGTSRVIIPAGGVGQMRLLTGGGNDFITLDTSGNSDPIPQGGLQALLGAGNDTLRLLNNSTNNNWRIREAGVGEVSVGGLGTVAFSGVQEVIGGTGEDRFDVIGGVATGMRLNGNQGGKDTFITKSDATFTLSDSEVSIAAGGVTRVFALAGIEIANLIGGDGNNMMNAYYFTGRAILDGGKGNDHLRGGGGDDLILAREGDDVLVGNGGDDQLYGDFGRDILSGGEGVDALNGGDGEDILLGGRYELDNVRAALDTIMAAWREPIFYAMRIAKIKDTGVGAAQQYRLSAATVFDDEKADSMTGGNDLDWFFGQVSAAYPGFESPARVTNEVLTALTPKRLRNLRT